MRPGTQDSASPRTLCTHVLNLISQSHIKQEWTLQCMHFNTDTCVSQSGTFLAGITVLIITN